MSTINYFLHNQYSIPKSDLTSHTLSVSVWDWDRLGSNDFLGEVQLHLSSLDLTDTIDHWYKLQDKVYNYSNFPYSNNNITPV